MRVARWADLDFSADVVGRLLEARGTPEDRQRFATARATPPPIPPGFAHHGVGGDALSAELAGQLGAPEIERALSVTFVPFAIGGPHRHAEGGEVHLIVAARRLKESWPATGDAAYAASVAEARRAVQRGAPSALEHVLWLEHFLVEQLLPVARELALPVVIRWPERRAVAVPPEELAPALDSALSSWED